VVEGMSTSYGATYNFVLGMGTVSQYGGSQFSISIIEANIISVVGLKTMSEDDLKLLHKCNWEAGNNSLGNGWARYAGLEYVDL
jgi:hypothetical protein